MTRSRVISLGSINADFQSRTTEALQDGKTLYASGFVRLSGGKAANRALLATRLRHPATLLGRVGDDDLRHQALGGLAQAGVTLTRVGTARGVGTAVSMITVPPSGKKTIVLANNANDAWDDTSLDALADAINEAERGSVLVTDYEVPAVAVERAVTFANRQRLRVVIDPSFAERVDKNVLGMAFAIAPNAKEAGDLTGLEIEDSVPAAAEAAKRLTALGIPLICIKLPSGGCVAVHNGACTVIPAQPVKAVDSTGAGDAFTGALAVAILEGKPPVEAACFATAAAQLAVQGYGSQESYPDRLKLDAILPSLLNRAHSYEQ